MKLIIDIRDDVYKSCRNLKNSPYNDNSFHDTAKFAIGNGTVLPDNHGRLIDADEIRITNYEIFTNDFKESLKLLIERIRNASTILEGTVKE